ncbi:hypothetical protein, partial [Escherichia coli]|uniref:hypothetical protein n=1 Tax=Escherichia coli TaxID=562 RepID=UPI001BDD735F
MLTSTGNEGAQTGDTQWEAQFAVNRATQPAIDASSEVRSSVLIGHQYVNRQRFVLIGLGDRVDS